MHANSTVNTIEERFTSLFQPDTLIVAQYAETFCTKSLPEPEKRLMLAVLEDALVCFQGHVLAKDRRKKRLFLAAKAWILEEDSKWLFSFKTICEVLGFDPGYVRHGLMKWKHQNGRRIYLTKTHPTNGKQKKARAISSAYQEQTSEPEELRAVAQ